MSKKQEQAFRDAEAVSRRRLSNGLNKNERSFTEDPIIKIGRLERENVELKEQSAKQAQPQSGPLETYDYELSRGVITETQLKTLGAVGYCVTPLGLQNGQPHWILRRRLT